MTNQEQKTILLVEDETVTMMVETHLLQGFGYDVVPAKSGEEAVQVAAGNDKIALVLMDVNLGPGIDGTEAAKQILGKRNLPIVFLSSHTDKEYVERIKGIAGYGYIVKNSGDVVLQSSIEMALNLFKAQEEIRRAKEGWERTFDSVPDLICLIDEKHTITRVNSAMADLLGVKPADAIGRKCYTCIHNTVQPPDFCPHVQLLNDGKKHEAEINEKNIGKWLHVTVAPLHNDAGNVIGAVHVARDITARKRAEEELAKACAGLEDKVRERTNELQERLDELERFRKATVKREFRINELRDEIERLKSEKNE